jgi:hypothetical protein
MANADATTIGAVNAIATIGTLADAKAPPASMPTQRHVMIIWPPGDALEKNKSGNIAHKAPSNDALRAALLIARAET